jgi:DNA processing protein
MATGTIAVIAGGIDVFYPPENEARQRAIAETGLLIAEQPPGVEPHARHFPYRNRIIAGLSLGTIVVEAAPRSGSLITARYAVEFGRDVMAVPGSPLDPRAQGVQRADPRRRGADPVGRDVMETIRPFAMRPLASPERRFQDAPADGDASEAERARVVDLLGHTAVAVDEIVRQSGLSPAAVQTVLLELDLAGRLERHAGGKVSLG